MPLITRQPPSKAACPAIEKPLLCLPQGLAWKVEMSCTRRPMPKKMTEMCLASQKRYVILFTALLPSMWWENNSQRNGNYH